MRLALLVHAAASTATPLDARLSRAGGALPELGFSVVEMTAHDEAALGLPRALEGVKRGGAVLAYVVAHVVRGPMGVVEIEAGARNVRFEELCSALSQAGSGEAVAIVDGFYDAPEDNPFEAAEVAAAIVRVMTAHAPWMSALVALRRPLPEGSTDDGLLTSAPVLELIVESARGAARAKGGSAQLTEVYERLREDGRIYAAAQALAYQKGASDFALARPAARPFEALPGVDENFAEAEAKIAEGALDEALDACKRVLLLAGDDKGRRAEVFVRIAAIKQRQGKGREAVFNLEKALSIDPAHRTALEGLILVAVGEQRWGDVEQLGARLVSAIGPARERFQALFDLGRIFQDSAGDGARALSALEKAAEIEPGDEDLVRRLVELYDRQKRHAELSSMLERYASLTDHAYQKAARLGAAARVAWKALGDSARAIRLYDLALRSRRDDADLFGEMAELLEQAGQVPHALRARQLAAVASPRKPATYRALVGLARKASREDVAFNAAMVLAHLGEADMDEELLADQHRPDGPLRAMRPLDPSAWHEHIAPATAPGAGALMGVFEAIDEAAIKARIGELRESGRLASFDASSRHDPRTSTVSAIRAFAFAGKLLGVPLPELHILPDVPGGVAAAPADRPTTVVGKQILSGRALPELSFLMARHLAYHRPGARVALYYPAFADLSALFLAAVQTVRPEVASSSANAAQIGRTRALLAPHLDEPSRLRLDAAVRAVEQEGGRPDLLPWQRTLELTATRAGLLACGDLGVAARLVEHDPAPVGDLAPSAKVDDLFAFSVSDAYEALRHDFGVAVGSPSMPPPSMPPPPAPPSSRRA